MDMDIEAGEAGDVVKSLVLLVFFAVFGYAYCTREVIREEVIEEPMDPNSMTKKDQKDFTKLAAEVQKEKEKVAKIEEKIKKFEEIMATKSNENLKKN